MDKLQDKIQGSLIGGAIGDALGYPVEFISYNEILARYGARGIKRLEASEYASGKAVVSDDTQMTLFTANGLLLTDQQTMTPLQGIKQAYLEWYETQTGQREGEASCWVRDVPELNHNRAPGTTCMSALSSLKHGVKPKNDSKGCGGVMRVAPIALYAAVGNRMDILHADKLAGDAAALTHLHPLGFISAALLSHIVYRIMQAGHVGRSDMEDSIRDGVEVMRKIYSEYQSDVQRMGELANLAISLSANAQTDIVNVRQLGEGWVGEEALAISLYCALKYIDNFEEAMIAAVNHSGDSDSTGAITGNILGAILGYEALPQFYKDTLEMHDLILHMADDVYRGAVSDFPVGEYFPSRESVE